MSLELEISDRAKDDVTRQYTWYAINASEEIAERYLRAFYATAGMLTVNPGLGRRQNFQAPRLRQLRSFRLEDSFEAHLIFYLTDDAKVMVERVMHGARNLPRRLLE